MANPFQRFTLDEINTMLTKYKTQLINEGADSTVSWSDGGHSEGLRSIPVLEMLEMLNGELDLRDTTQAGFDQAKAIFPR